MDEFGQMRERMVRDQLEGRGIKNPKVLDAFRSVPRHAFVPEELRSVAYDDCPVATFAGQTISQPYMVALMTDLLSVTAQPLKILEVGTGSGYQAAILAYLGHQVVSIERIPELASFARENLSHLAFDGDVTVVEGDGSLGYPNELPYDRIVVTAAAPHIPEKLVEQLVIGGRLVIPCGPRHTQDLLLIDRISKTETHETRSIACRFVPLLGQDGF